jgi:hypothetical protein
MKPESRQTVYTTDQIVALLVRAGIPNKDIPMMVALALAESEGKVGAIGDKKLVDDKWDESIGLWQIRSLKDPNNPAYNETDKLRIKEKLFDPIYNAQTAYAISKQGKDWTDWSTYNDESYKNYMSAGPSRSTKRVDIQNKLKIAGGGRGRSKPITMAEEQNNQNQSLFESAVSGMPGYISSTELDIDSQIKEEKSKLKALQADFKLLNSNVTQKDIDQQKQKVKDLEDKYKTVVKQRKESTKLESQKLTTESDIQGIDKQITYLENELKRTKETGKLPVVPGQRGPASPATKSYVADIESKLKNLKDQKQTLGQTTTTEKPVVEERALPVNQANKVDFGGQPKPQVPQGNGETVYLGQLQTSKEVPIPSLGAKTETRTTTIGAATSEPMDLATLKGMWFSNAPEAKRLVDRFKAVYAANGKTATEKDWNDALATTAGINMSNGGQTLWETAETMIKSGAAGGAGTGPSAKELNNKKETVRLLATELGVELSDSQINSIGYSYANGELDATTIRSRIAQIGNINFSMGEASKTVDALKQTAAAYGVSYSPDWYTQSAKDILTGKVDNDTLNQQLKELAKSRYPSLAKQIDAGYTVKQIASPYLQSMATLLEINPNDISLEDPTIKQAFTSIDDQGQPTTRPLWQFEKELKQDPRWAYTKNAQQELMGTAYKVLSDFGLVF